MGFRQTEADYYIRQVTLCSGTLKKRYRDTYSLSSISACFTNTGNYRDRRFEVLMAAIMNVTVFWV
jgi:hypothetical protein